MSRDQGYRDVILRAKPEGSRRISEGSFAAVQDDTAVSDSSAALRPQNDKLFNVAALRREFPILTRTMRGQPLRYLDNASTTQKPQRVIDAEARFYETMNANIHRGVYELSEEATAAYVAAHEAVARFIGAAGAEEIVFVRNATEGINLVAQAVGSPTSPRLRRASRQWAVGAGDAILLTAMEHHSNIVPWQQVARRTGARLEWVELTPDGNLADLKHQVFEVRPQTPGVCLLAVTHVSNVLGTVNPIPEAVRLAHEAGALVLVDAAQSAGKLPVDVRAWDADFVVFSGHKMYGPTGVGVLYAKREHLERMEPFLTGGDMVKTVTRERATWNDLPWKFEAGTPNIAGGVALGEAVRFLQEIGMDKVWAHEQALVRYARPKLQTIPGLTLLGPKVREEGSRQPDSAKASPRGQAVGSRETRTTAHCLLPHADRAGIFSFTLPGIHSHDLASFLDARGIAIRGGHHCAQPLLATLGLTECARASVGVYTTNEEIDQLVGALEEARKVFA